MSKLTTITIVSQTARKKIFLKIIKSKKMSNKSKII